MPLPMGWTFEDGFILNVPTNSNNESLVKLKQANTKIEVDAEAEMCLLFLLPSSVVSQKAGRSLENEHTKTTF